MLYRRVNLLINLLSILFFVSSLSTLVQISAFYHGFTFLPEMEVKKNLGKNEGLTIAPLDRDYYREIGVLWQKRRCEKLYIMNYPKLFLVY
jgi:hypothetical protein